MGGGTCGLRVGAMLWVDVGTISAMALWILHSCECVLPSVPHSGILSSTSVLVLYSSGKAVDLRRIGWHLGGVVVHRAKFRRLCWSRTADGGKEASSSIGIIGDVRKAPRIRLHAVFGSFCSLSTYLFCLFYKSSALKSRIGVTQLVYRRRGC